MARSALPTKGTPRFEFDRKFQEAIICLLYQDPEFALGSLDKLDPDYFEEPHHRWMAKTIYWAHKTLGSAPNIGVLLNEATKAVQAGIISDAMAPLVTKLLKGLKKPVSNKTYVVAEVTEFCKEQAWKSVILKAVDEHLPARRFDLLAKDMLDTAHYDFSADGGIGEFFFESAEKRQARREKFKANGIPTGLKLDAYMKTQGPPPNSLSVVLASTGKGKTNWLIDRAAVGLTELDDLQVAYYTFELDSDMVGERFDARFTDIPIRLLATAGQQYREKMEDVKEKLGGRLVIKEFPMGSVSVSAIHAHLRSLERVAFYPKLVIIDYADLLMPSTDFGDDYQNAGRIYMDLKALAKIRKCAIWTASQGNRESMKEDVETTDLVHMADSIKKAQLADLIVPISQTVEERKAGRCRASLAKNRFGPAGIDVTLKVDHEKAAFRDV